MKKLLLVGLFMMVSGISNILYALDTTDCGVTVINGIVIKNSCETNDDNGSTAEGIAQCKKDPSSCGIINDDGSTAEGIAQCKKNPISCGINISPGDGSKDISKLSYNATARLVPQVIMAGASPSVIDFNDNNLDVLAIVRPGALVISSVSLSQNGGGTFRIDMTKIATLSNNDQVWQSKVSFDRGSFGTGSVPITWGDGVGEFSITVTDGQQRSESFPSLKAGNYPILENK